MMHDLRPLIKDGLSGMRVVGIDQGVKLIEIALTNAQIDAIVAVRLSNQRGKT